VKLNVPARSFNAPWTNDATEWLVARLWPTLEEFVNTPHEKAVVEWPKLASAWVDLRAGLDRILAKQPPWSGHGRTPPLLLVIRGGRVDWVLRQPEPPDTTKGAEEWASLWAFVVILLWHRTLRPRLWTCAECGRYHLARAARLEKKTSHRRFCCDACRKLWAKSPVGRAENAARNKVYWTGTSRDAAKARLKLGRRS
jgi:hypothetical protein